MKSKNYSFTALLLSVVAAMVLTQNVHAATYEISGNGTGTDNSININQDNSTELNQSNSANVNNDVDVTANTGGNSINGGVGDGSINTGDINTNINIFNQLNSNNANVNCNNCQNNPTPTVKNGPTSTPKPVSNGGGGGSSSSGGGTGGSNGARYGEVIGTSTMAPTGTIGSTIATIEQALGFVLTAAGALIYGKKKEVRSKKK